MAGNTRPLPAPAVSELEQLLDRFAELLAAKLAPHLAPAPPQPNPAAETTRLVTLDQLVALLPTSKPAKTWKSWLYQHTRQHRVPGTVKIAGRLYFHPDQALNWITNHHKHPETTGSSDQTEQQCSSMPAKTTQPGTQREIE